MSEVVIEDVSLADVDDHIIMFPDHFSGDWITLGAGDYCSAKLEGLGSPELQTDELMLPGRDGAIFGREYYGSRKWTVSGVIKTGAVQNAPGTPEDAWNALATLMRAWDYNPARETARGVIPLLWKRPGRETVVIYGRPERIDPETNLAHAGFITYTAVFRQSDPKFYGAEEEVITSSLVAPPSGGLLLNGGMTALLAVSGKMQTTAVVTVPGVVVVDGDIDTPPIIIFHGPSVNPTVKMLNKFGGVRWRVRLEAEVGYGETVTVDTRLWQQTVYRNDGSNMSGFIRSPRLSDITIPVGKNIVEYSGQDASSTSMCEIRYRNAWASV